MRTSKGQRLFWSRHIRSRWLRPCHGGYGQSHPCHGCYGQSRRARLVTAVHVRHVGLARGLGQLGQAGRVRPCREVKISESRWARLRYLHYHGMRNDTGIVLFSLCVHRTADAVSPPAVLHCTSVQPSHYPIWLCRPDMVTEGNVTETRCVCVCASPLCVYVCVRARACVCVCKCVCACACVWVRALKAAPQRREGGAAQAA